MKVLFTEPQVQYPNKLYGDVRAEVGIRLNYALLAGYIREHADVRIQPYRLLDFSVIPYSLEEDISQADIVCIGASTAEAKSARRIIEEARRQGKVTIAGGIFPSANPNYLGADYTVIGEGERPLLEIVKDLSQGLEPRVERLTLSDIDSVEPAYDLLPMQLYRDHVKGLVYTARGCENDCSFCTVSPHWLNSRRVRSVDSVVRELEMYRSLGFDSVNFKDESLTVDRERLFSLLDRISGLGLKYKGKATIRELDSSIVTKMREAGFVEIHTGVESVTQAFEKGISAQDVVAKIQMCLDAGLVVNPSFILGLPRQSRSDLLEDAKFIMDVGSDPRVKVYTCMYTPHPSSQIYGDDDFTLVSNDLDDFTHLRLVALPKSFGRPRKALDLLYGTQREVVSKVGGMELPLDVDKILRDNPELKDVRK
jgi:anaerobic magnesium-protoporphyrin IX monomethyl ester cyclase